MAFLTLLLLLLFATQLPWKGCARLPSFTTIPEEPAARRGLGGSKAARFPQKQPTDTGQVSLPLSSLHPLQSLRRGVACCAVFSFPLGLTNVCRSGESVRSEVSENVFFWLISPAGTGRGSRTDDCRFLNSCWNSPGRTNLDTCAMGNTGPWSQLMLGPGYFWFH